VKNRNSDLRFTTCTDADSGCTDADVKNRNSDLRFTTYDLRCSGCTFPPTKVETNERMAYSDESLDTTYLRLTL